VNGGLRARVVAVHAIDEGALARMWALFAATYDEVHEDVFRADFAAKDHVILLEDGDGVQGFSTLRELAVTVAGVRHVGMFSGDTVLSQRWWGSRVLGRAFLGHLARRRLANLRDPYWWILIAKGYKTYLMMANNFPVHWPRHETATPAGTQAVMGAFGGALFGPAYDPDAGRVRWDAPRGRLRPGVADVTPDLRAARPRVDFFARANPGWAEGDELFCLARMDLDMPLRYAWKSLRAGLGRAA
jgi:hypothetical protein